MLSSAKPVAFVPSTDLNRSREFYENTLELPVIHADDFAVVVECAGVSVRITNAGPNLRVQPFTVLGWDVEDIHAHVDQLVARGIEFLHVDGIDQDEAGVWTTPDDSQVAWFKDPDDNTLSLSHHP